MLQIVKKNLAKLSNYPRLRILLIVVAVIIVFIIFMNFLTPNSTKNSGAPPSAVQTVGTKGGTQKSAPANQTSQYQNLSSTDQAANEQKAIKSGGSVFENVPTPQDQTNTQPEKNAPISTIPAPSQNQQDDGKKDQLTQQISALQQQLQEQQANQNNQQLAAHQQAMNAQLQNIQSSMRSGIQNLSDSWKLPTATTVVGDNANDASNAAGATAQPPVAIKAGSILFGVIDTALDSDSPGTPVLATIVTGPYRGARLMGGFTATKQALAVQFNLMTLPNGASGIPINAWAIDAKTANNAVATNVDNHYLLRYGMLFASAFLQGFGNAYQNYTYCNPGAQNCSVINTSGNSNLPSNSVTAQTAAYQGLGQLGTSLSQAAAQQFNTPPTITVDQGTGIGVLFMSDVRIPVNQ